MNSSSNFSSSNSTAALASTLSAVQVSDAKCSFSDIVLDLSSLAESFRKMERLFMTETRDSNFLYQVCQTAIAASNQKMSVKLPKVLPTEYENIAYNYHQKERKWKETRTTLTINQEAIQQEVNAFCEQIDSLVKRNPSFLKAYFSRQKAFYNLNYEVKESSGNKKNLVYSDEQQYIPILTAQFYVYEELLCYSPEKTAELVCAILRSAAVITPAIWGKVALTVFVGRDLSSDGSLLHPEVKKYVVELEDICTKLHKELYAATKSNKTVVNQAAAITSGSKEKQTHEPVKHLVSQVGTFKPVAQIPQPTSSEIINLKVDDFQASLEECSYLLQRRKAQQNLTAFPPISVEECMHLLERRKEQRNLFNASI